MAEKNSRGKRKPAYQVRLERTLDLVTSERNELSYRLLDAEENRDYFSARLDTAQAQRDDALKQVADLERRLQCARQEKSDADNARARTERDKNDVIDQRQAALSVVEKLLHALELAPGPDRERVLLDALTQMRHLPPFV